VNPRPSLLKLFGVFTFIPERFRAKEWSSSFGFEREGYLRRHRRRQTGELRESVVMGLLFEGE
jgi:hypothetical protein